MSQQPYPGQPGPDQPNNYGQQQSPYTPPPQPPYANQYPYPPQQPPKKKHGCLWAMLIAIGVIVVLIIFIAIGSSGSSSSSTGDSGTASAAPAEKTAKIGQSVNAGDIAVTVTAFKCGVTVKDFADTPIKPQGQFCSLDVTFRNNGSDQVEVDDSDLSLHDAKGASYRTSSDTLVGDDSIFLKKVNPGNTLKGVAYFDVPKGTSPIAAQFDGSIFSSPAKVALK